MTYQEIIRLIDEYIESDDYTSSEWVIALNICKQLLIDKINNKI